MDYLTLVECLHQYYKQRERGMKFIFEGYNIHGDRVLLWEGLALTRKDYIEKYTLLILNAGPNVAYTSARFSLVMDKPA